MNTRKLVVSALLVAMITVLTMFVKIPLSAFGYVHLGDTIIFLACFLLGLKYSLVVAGLGSALADVLLGYYIYAPVTFAVKLLVALAFTLLTSKKSSIVMQIIGVVVCSVIIALGYYIFEGFMYGFLPSAYNILFNLAQGGVCGAIGVLIIRIFDKVKPLKEFKNKLN
jgi:uncharacterized membrane protein